MKKKSNRRYLLPGEEAKPPIPVSRVVLWSFIVALVSMWIILGIRIDVPEASASTATHEAITLRRQEVKALEDIAGSLKKIARELERR